MSNCDRTYLKCCVHVLSARLTTAHVFSLQNIPLHQSYHPLLPCLTHFTILTLTPSVLVFRLTLHSHLHHLLHVSSSSGPLVSQNALFQAILLGSSSMGGAWVGKESTDWTLTLRTGALAGHPPSASDGRGH